MRVPFSRRASEAPEAPGVHAESVVEPPPAIGPRGRRRGGLELPAARLPGEGLQALARLELLLLARHDLRGAVPAADRVGAAAALPLRALGRAGLPVREGHRVRRDLRLVDPGRPPDRRPPDGGGGRPAPRTRVPDWRVQERRRAGAAARVELGDRRRDAAADAVPLVHGLPAAVGPARLLGGHRRHEHRLVSALRRPADSRAADRGTRDRAGDADSLLRAARHRAPAAGWACCSGTTCGGSGRTAASRRRTARRCWRRRSRPRPRRPRPTRCSAWRAARRPPCGRAAWRRPT